ncbi:MAG: hypothetical protein JSR45_02185 [Proteobacteria bacterium]|nr:hypothetical protein [Pseudomonadota bacterium]
MTQSIRVTLAATAIAALSLAACSKPAANGQAGQQGGGFMGMGGPAVQWTTFTDPNEHSFSVEVPVGWQVQGGLRRLTTQDVRSEIVARSPDGSMEVFLGDQSVPNFVMPNQMTEFAGMREGSPYQIGYGNVAIIARYAPGDVFARTWGANRISRVCGGPRQIAGAPLPQADQAIDFGYQQGGVQASTRSGEAKFDCSWQGAPGAGYAFATTLAAQVQGGAGMWQASSMSGFASRADHAQQAADILAHMNATFQLDQNWSQRQSGAVMNASRIVAATQEAVSQSIKSSFDYKNAVHDRAMEHWAQATRGTATFNDPVNGPRELENTEHQWRLRDGRTVGTNTSTPPEPGATELQRAH